MRLVRFTVTNYRSMVSTPPIDVSDTTVLIGKNNEGKSNILAALTAAMTVVNELGDAPVIQGRVRLRPGARNIYQWERDFPIQLQESRPNGESVCRLDFFLSDSERDEFRTSIRSSVNEVLPIEVHFGRGDPAFRVIKQGKGSKGLNSKAPQIAKFIGDRVEFTYIPAVRTAEAALNFVGSLVFRELAKLNTDAKYQKALRDLEALRQPILKSISKRIQDALKDFVPRVVGVDVKFHEDARLMFGRRNVDVLIDDGTVTSLAAKGDGVQSLVAIGLLRGLNPSGKDLILALEEPESHLHPGAIHQLRDVIFALGSEHQVVLTTHCPLFADRIDFKANIIVSDNKAAPAKSIAEIREVLGVRISDNLAHASHVLVVEGASDVRILNALLASISTKLKRALGHTLALDHTSGSGNLSYKLSELANAMCVIHCYFDHDKAANDAIARALSARLISQADVQQVICKGMVESEIEDMFKTDIYQAQLETAFGVKLMVKEFRNSNKWSERLKRVFLSQGKRWTSTVERDVKELVADVVASSPTDSLIDAKRSSLDALVAALEAKLSRQLGDHMRAG